MTQLQEWVTKLNVASRKKATLMAFCQTELQLPVNEKETMEIMQKKALEKIYLFTKSSGQDPMGFGQYSNLSYQEVMDNHPSYGPWAVKTMNEGDCSNRLRRFAQWYQEALKMPASSTLTAQSTPKKEKPETKTAHEESPETHHLMAKMVAAITNLQEELAELKEERPRKKKDDGSISDFSLMTDQ